MVMGLSNQMLMGKKKITPNVEISNLDRLSSWVGFSVIYGNPYEI